ncbi:MAG: hypothetical protein UY26_C0003G0114 [Candidatus Jorgensenbacteria bacterium GW2011_GWA1_48_13]|uniref:Uncharacterized protein n=1 Tax=Candidatus Jorgensenbacteria bacterium GW2011_GWB1_50_10 TaxID=1618665 RepID=A0A0G1YJB7_9BACT|nr:MAG: hypothetical protein UY26_C0003G0114 [Candidatus Jorgensenbacteria bacterium GW2011_GWA1_48_13]KKW15072.1 MAG: hypothetical protein UY55_C0002G0130 [Candidatus Jorgensenbacteria bacterium GW2011_GWB1_50_10]
MFKLPSLNRFSSRKEWETACWQEMLKSKTLLKSLVTSYERHNLVMRAAVREGINSGKRFRQIAREMGLSLQTVSSIKKALREGDYRSYRERSKTERKKKIYGSHPSKKKPYRYYRRTKYGKVYMHHY